MRRRALFSLVLLVCALAAAAAASSCVKLPRRPGGAAGQSAPPAPRAEIGTAPLVNINAASAAELEKLPGIGRSLAARIVEHRAKYGRFHRPEHLMMVRGLSERRFRTLRSLITAE